MNDELSPLIYADEITQSLSKAVAWGSEFMNTVPGLLKQVLEREMWKRRYVVRTGQIVEFESFTQYIIQPPLEGLGTEPYKLLAMLRDAPDLSRQVAGLLNRETSLTPANGTGQQRAGKAPKDVEGASRAYTALRLKQEGHSELADQVSEGRVTVSDARRKLGWKAEKVAVRTDDPGSAATTLERYMRPEALHELALLLLQITERRDQLEAVIA
jgi:hypothetical protein